MKKVIRVLGSGKGQRLIYTLLLFIWIVLNISQNIYDLSYETSFGVIYLWIFLFPATMLLSQIVFNSYFGWVMAFFLYISFVLYLMAAFGLDLYSHIQDYPGSPDLDYLFAGFVLLIMTGIGFIIYITKPKV